ncbi:ANTAR domain-containing response regulator [Paracoccus sp. SCSIO 75233]|uniref:ANTAR domain-containing response regulator n=1 Tax=Paracoccus sp. SCSIO 75233 TaxID=3017782 RepID=UPI0022F142EE|nr:ANTAR domain-containing protein [Paracoccus sp. SCSIO 75233]WBU54471.1 ANTAR domain-containing protein [Paracoccus sp. SCSIO 75233]
MRILELAGARALILHRPHTAITALERQLAAIGLHSEVIWPELPAECDADFLFFDVDMGFDAQFPWPAGQSPMPMIALIGSEAPGRIEWSLARGAHAQLLKPVGDSGVYSALLIARATYQAQACYAAEVAGLRDRLAGRETVVRAVMALVAQGMSDEDAFAKLRRLATDRRESFEAAAERVVAQFDPSGRRGNGR